MGTGIASGENRAIEAAEAAIRSPLLEDVNLQGARGILINITAGENLTLGEFTEVGDTISEFASEQANVVIGTVIDPTMGDEICVTVVATGLGGLHERPTKVVDNTNTGKNIDFNSLDRPAVMRRGTQAQPSSQPSMAKAVGADSDMDYLDIPAFLRKQAD
jgi:cell division protein FtsZ